MSCQSGASVKKPPTSDVRTLISYIAARPGTGLPQQWDKPLINSALHAIIEENKWRRRDGRPLPLVWISDTSNAILRDIDRSTKPSSKKKGNNTSNPSSQIRIAVPSIESSKNALDPRDGWAVERRRRMQAAVDSADLHLSFPHGGAPHLSTYSHLVSEIHRQLAMRNWMLPIKLGFDVKSTYDEVLRGVAVRVNVRYKLEISDIVLPTEDNQSRTYQVEKELSSANPQAQSTDVKSKNPRLADFTFGPTIPRRLPTPPRLSYSGTTGTSWAGDSSRPSSTTRNENVELMDTLQRHPRTLRLERVDTSPRVESTHKHIKPQRVDTPPSVGPTPHHVKSETKSHGVSINTEILSSPSTLTQLATASPRLLVILKIKPRILALLPKTSCAPVSRKRKVMPEEWEWDGEMMGWKKMKLDVNGT